MLVSRIITAVVGAAVVLWLVSLGGWAFKAAIAILAFVGLLELKGMADRNHIGMDLWLPSILTIAVIGFPFTVYGHWPIAISLIMIVLLAYSVFDYRRFNLAKMSMTLFACFYLPILFSFVVLIRDTNRGVAWLTVAFAITWGYDIAAFFVGSAIGRHPLCPDLSPKKSVEGVVGGLCVSSLAAAATGLYHGFNPAVLALLGLLGGGIAQIGDLAESSIKRQFHTKDTGNLLPGHGGILDRFDSFLVVAPFVYIFLSLKIL